MKEDYYTSTVDGAMGFQRVFGEREVEDIDIDVDYDESESEDEDYYDDDYCNCSDPGCPCGGTKRGGV